MNELIAYGVPGGRTLKRFRLRQGLPPVLDDDAVESYIESTANTSYNASMKLSPDGRKLVAAAGYSGTPGRFWTWPDATDPETQVVPLASFSGIVRCCDCSDTHYAVGGASPFLYVFDWATHSLQTLSTTGLGEVYAVAFSPDGERLAVAHATAPYLRVYSTADWSFANAPASAGGSRKTACFSADGSVLLTTGTTSPYLTAFAGDLSALSYSSTSYEFYTYNWASVSRHHSKPKAFICCAGQSTNTSVRKLYEFDGDGNVVTVIMEPALTVSALSAVHDPLSNKLYVAHSDWDGRRISTFDADTYERDADMPSGMTLLMQSEMVVMAVASVDLHQITGTVTDSVGQPAQRVVRAYRRSDGLLLAQTLSDEADGSYTLIVPDDAQCDVQFMGLDGELLNDLFYARAQPELVV